MKIPKIKIKYCLNSLGGNKMKKDIKEVIVTEKQIKDLCVKLGKQITLDYKDKENPILLGLLKGCIPFMSDLMKYIDLPVEVEFMDVKSYHGEFLLLVILRLEWILILLFIIEILLFVKILLILVKL